MPNPELPHGYNRNCVIVTVLFCIQIADVSIIKHDEIQISRSET